MTLLRTSLLNAIALAIRILTGVGLGKLLAITVGPAGFAIVGQFQSLVAVATSFAGGAINNGVVKFTAAHGESPQDQQRYWRTASKMAVIASFSAGIILTVGSAPIAQWILNDASYAGVVVAFGLTIPLLALHYLLIAIINGQQRIGRYVQINIAGSLVALVGVGGFALLGGLEGALYAIALQQAMLCVVTVFRSGLPFRDWWGAYDPVCAKRLGEFILMALTAAICTPLTQLFIRQSIANQYGWDAAGQWLALNRISDLYLMAVTTPMAVYFLPKFSEAHESSTLFAEIRKGLAFLMPIAIFSGSIIYLLKDFIISLLFSRAFYPMSDWFSIQLFGDGLRVAGWLFGYALIATAMTKIFIVIELSFSLLYGGLAFFLIPIHGVAGACYSYLIAYSIIVPLVLLGLVLSLRRNNG